MVTFFFFEKKNKNKINIIYYKTIVGLKNYYYLNSLMIILKSLSFN